MASSCESSRKSSGSIKGEELYEIKNCQFLMKKYAKLNWCITHESQIDQYK